MNEKHVIYDEGTEQKYSLNEAFSDPRSENKSELTVGRHRECDITLGLTNEKDETGKRKRVDDVCLENLLKKTSRQHGKIIKDVEDNIYFQDTSSYGTTIKRGGEECNLHGSCEILHDGDEILTPYPLTYRAEPLN